VPAQGGEGGKNQGCKRPIKKDVGVLKRDGISPQGKKKKIIGRLKGSGEGRKFLLGETERTKQVREKKSGRVENLGGKSIQKQKRGKSKRVEAGTTV